MKKMERVVSQMTSGRWLLTIVAAMCLLLFTVTDCWATYKGKEPPISPEAIATIITMVFMSYFKNPKEDGDEDDDEPTPPVAPPKPIGEGTESKGGVNEKPVASPPAEPPKGQG